jgi:hypothetical protein
MQAHWQWARKAVCSHPCPQWLASKQIFNGRMRLPVAARVGSSALRLRRRREANRSEA